MKLPILLLAFMALPMLGQTLAQLPEWASREAAVSLRETPPPDVDAWVLFMRHEVAYMGDGEIRTRTLRLVKVLGERGLNEGVFCVHSLGGRAGKIKTLKGWNLRPDDELVKLSRGDVGVVDTDSWDETSTSFATVAAIPRVAVGSLIAFESEEVSRLPMGPVDEECVAEDIPIRKWEITFAKKAGWFADLKDVEVHLDPWHWESWGLVPERLPGGGLAAHHIQAIPKDEGAHPHWINLLPSVELRFLDPNLTTAPFCGSWGRLGAWTYAYYRQAMVPSGVIPVKGLEPKAGLQAIHAWMAKELVYKQAYLTPDRGWKPEACPEVVRKRYGDCKDHATCFMGESSVLGFEVFPALCRIGEGEIEAEQPVSPYAFNHVVAALRLKESLGWPAEFETPQGRFLLVDTTDRYCPLGLLPAVHRNGRVMICMPAGAVWVTVPAAATLEPKLRIEITGKVDETGTVTADVHLWETGNARSLRALALEGSQQMLKTKLAQGGFRLSSAGTLSEPTISDPLDLGCPFELNFRITDSKIITIGNNSIYLVDWGLPDVPRPIQKPGVPRQLPVESKWRNRLEIHEKWTFPFHVSPTLADVCKKSPFMDLEWHTKTEKTRLEIDFSQWLKSAKFEETQKEIGVKTWKEDRNFILKFREKALHLVLLQ